jgi:Hemerythrin HHE cation binding domain
MMEINSVQAKRLIEEEHRSLAAVLLGMLYWYAKFAMWELSRISCCLGEWSTTLMRFIDCLKQEHESGAVKLRELQQALTSYQHGSSAEFAKFAPLVAGNAAFHWEHMRLEENDLLPLAERHLTDEDWDAIGAAFLGHTDPLLGAEQGDEYRDLFRHLVKLAPPPIGVAPVR